VNFKIYSRLLSFSLGVWLLLVATALSCLGQGVIYNSRSAFNTAIASLAGSRRDLNFEGALPPGGTDFGGFVGYISPLTVSGVKFRGSIFLHDTARGRDLINYDSLAPLMVEMDGPAIAFGADFSSLLSPAYSSFTATVLLDSGERFTFAAPANPNFAFFGFMTSQPFSSLTFSDGGLIAGYLHEEIIDNITVIVVPEPSVVGLLASGTLLLGWRFARRC
jgi:hypothetical protein